MHASISYYYQRSKQLGCLKFYNYFLAKKKNCVNTKNRCADGLKWKVKWKVKKYIIYFKKKSFATLKNVYCNI